MNSLFFPITYLRKRAPVSDKTNKNKGTNFSRTYRKEPGGGVSPVTPKPSSKTESSLSPMEPVFELELEMPESSFSQSQAEVSQIQHQLSQIQPQIDNFSKLEKGKEVSGNQVEVLRKYIALKENESQDLKEQQKQYQAYVRKLTAQIQALNGKLQDHVAELENLKRRDESSRLEAREIEKRYREDMLRQKNEYEDRIRRSGNVSQEYKELERDREEWKDKVREDLKRIKLKERELENKYELLKRDTQALLDSKDKHVLELKRKNDALELEMESLEERLRNATLSVSAVEAKKRRLIETMRLAISLLEEMNQMEASENPRKKSG